MKIINNKKIITLIVGSLLLILVGGLLIWNLNSVNKTKLDEVRLKYENDNSSMFAIMLEEIDEEGNSTYVESNDNMWPSLKYRYNTNNSGCLDINGISIPDILSYDSKNQKAIVKTKKVAYCYLYFDIDESVYAKVRSDYTDNNGALLLSETESDEFPVYYYNGNITNNNILYANFCWKMVRTTETGGVKLIYNGVPDESEDGTVTCDNTGEESQIGTSRFNNLSYSLADVGYMYNSIYKAVTKNFTINTEILSKVSNKVAYYYGNIATWDGSKYVLSNSDGSEVTTYTWADNYTNLIGKYTCLSTTTTSCETVYYVAGGTSSQMYYYGISNNSTKDDYKIKLSKEVTSNEDGTYTLVDPIEVLKADYANNYSNYINYYYCEDLVSETCDVMYYAGSTNAYQLTGYNMANVYKYGNSFTYENGKYTLVDVDEFWNLKDDYALLNNHHYTCFNTTGECEQIYYIYFLKNGAVYYITLSEGKTVENALNEMLYADDVNTTDSAIKDYIDTWYEEAILDKISENGILYSKYLENTIFCNNRATINLSSSGWNPNGGNISTILQFNANALECENKTDQFTLKVEAGGTEGYGNNALDYPVGLISYKEANLATGTGYLKSGMYYWLLSPVSLNGNTANMQRLSSGSGWSDYVVSYIYGVRPVVSLSNKVEIIDGNGSVTTPYQIILLN